MGVNPKLPLEQKVITYLSQITAALQNIARNLSYGFGPTRTEEMWNPSEEMEKQIKENDEISRRKREIEELKKSNKIALRTARIAVFGLILTAILGVFQLILTWAEYMNSSLEKDRFYGTISKLIENQNNSSCESN